MRAHAELLAGKILLCVGGDQHEINESVAARLALDLIAILSRKEPLATVFQRALRIEPHAPIAFAG